VATSKATLGSIPIEFTALGTVTPLATVNVTARVSGMLDKVAFREGQMVRAGQLLVQIDPRPFQVAVDQAQAQLLHDQALLVNARLDLTRYNTLRKQDSVAGQTVDTQAALVSQDEATVKADQAALANARLNLSFAHITSPVSGRVGLRQVDAGNQISANSTTPIAVVTQISPITVVFSLPEDDIPPIVQNSRAGGRRLPVTVLDRDAGAVLAHGELETLDNVIDTTTGTVKAKAQFANTDGALFPSQFVNVTLLVNTLQNQVIVPTTAVHHGPQGDFAWVLQPGQTVKNRPVKIGPGTAETVSIVSGLQAGETVITEGGDRLRDGAKVVLPGQRPAGGGRGGKRRSHGGGAPAGE
jgi:multidrug efflux system membrane fusion protein